MATDIGATAAIGCVGIDKGDPGCSAYLVAVLGMLPPVIDSIIVRRGQVMA